MNLTHDSRTLNARSKAIPMPQPHLRKARMKFALQTLSCTIETRLPPGDWFVEQRTEVIQVFEDPEGARHVADLSVIDFLEGLAKRRIVFVSWG